MNLRNQGLQSASEEDSPRPSDPQDLPRLHDVVGVERLLDRAHDAERLAVLGNDAEEPTATSIRLSHSDPNICADLDCHG